MKVIMNKLTPIAIAATITAALALTGCSTGSDTASSSASSSSSSSSSTPEPTKEAAEPADLTGTWKQTNSAAADSYQEAEITGNDITINWVADNGDTKSIYRCGDAVQVDLHPRRRSDRVGHARLERCH
jgi:ABC-type glycerol-3-phosphate transport system substrate-binding protein